MIGALSILLISILAYHLVARRKLTPLAPPSFSVPSLPAFLSGLVAIARLGANEDEFLKALRAEYGAVVYLPWPLRQYLILEAEAIECVYKAPSRVLSFFPIRVEMQSSVFDAGFETEKSLMEEFYKTHSRGLQKIQLAETMDRFVKVVEAEIGKLATRLDASEDGQIECNLDEWVTDIFFEASLSGLFGPLVRQSSGISKTEFRTAFDAFDGAFPLLASGLVPKPFANIVFGKGKKAQKVLADSLEAWIEEDFPGLPTGVVRDMAQVALDNGLGKREAGKLLVSDAWALQANAPYVASQLLLYLIQAPQSILDDVVAECDRSISLARNSSSSPQSIDHLSQNFPLLQSCLTETLRIGTSVFSIRDVEQPLHLRSRGGTEVVVPPMSRLIYATRASHLDQTTWGDDVCKWDGRRFFDREGGGEKDEGGETVEKSKKSRQVWGFGGGISRCEGNVLATLELKSFVSTILTKFEVSLVGPTTTDSQDYEAVEFARGEAGYRPKRRTGRVGLGVLQFDKDVMVAIRKRRLAGTE